MISRPFFTMAAAVSSQLVSIPNTYVSFFIVNSPTSQSHLHDCPYNNFYEPHQEQDQIYGTSVEQPYSKTELLMTAVSLLATELVGRHMQRAFHHSDYPDIDRKSTRLNSSHVSISYA